MRLIAASPLLVLLFAGIHAEASVPAHVHELCLKAVDYPGCVRSQQGSPLMRESVRNGESTKLGNICPNGYAYISDDICQKVDATCSVRSKNVAQKPRKSRHCKFATKERKYYVLRNSSVQIV